ncbi:MAG: hypothetical protein WA941_03390, partial [Nitrososphaeraceae archaeon]
SILNREGFSVCIIKKCYSYLNMGKWKCLWCSKVIEGESFMDLVMTSTNNEQPHAWENITLLEEEIDMANKLLPSLHS